MTAPDISGRGLMYGSAGDGAWDQPVRADACALYDEPTESHTFLAQIQESLRHYRDETAEFLAHHRVLAFHEELCRQIFDLANRLPREWDVRETLRAVIKDALDLSEQDMVMFREGQIIIRAHKREQEEEPVLDDKYFKELVKALCADQPKVWVRKTVEELCADALDFRTLTNHHFERNHPVLIVQAFTAGFEKVTEDHKIAKAAAKALFVRQRSLVYKTLADQLLAALLEDGSKAFGFLQYYSGEVAVFGNRRYRLPAIVDTEERRWKPATILSVARQHRQARARMETQLKERNTVEERRNLLEQEVEKLTEELAQIKARHEEAQNLVSDYGDRLVKARENLGGLRARRHKAKSKEHPALDRQIEEVSEEIKTLCKEDESAFRERSRTKVALEEREKTLHDKRAKLDALRYAATGEGEEENGPAVNPADEKIMRAHTLVRIALASTLSKKKEPIEQ